MDNTRIKAPFATALSICLAMLVPACTTPMSRGFAMEVGRAYDATLPYPNSVFLSIDGAIVHARLFEPDSNAANGSAILLHGLGGSTFCWRFLAPALAASGYRCIAVDVPPFGFSGPMDPLPKDADSRALLLWKAVDSLMVDLETCVVIGHSLGGKYALSMESARPGVVDALVLFAPAIAHPNATSGGAKAGASLPLSFLDWTMKEAWAVSKLLGSAYGRDPTRSELSGYIAPFLRPEASRGFAEWALSEKGNDPDPRDSTAPAMLIWGECDAWVPASDGPSLREQMNVQEYLVIPDAGHCPMETHPDASIPPVLSFLTTINRRKN
jgi:pimeloyl-ACP methyl ester carboxylesterase